MQKTLSVNAIENGTVIDHIPAGQGIAIIRLLKLTDHHYRVTIGLNLKSSRQGLKDLIKIEGRYLNQQEINHLSLFAEHATINQIKNFQVSAKHDIALAQQIDGLLTCPNPNCISNQEPVKTRFTLAQDGTNKLHCYYCEKSFTQQAIKEYAE